MFGSALSRQDQIIGWIQTLACRRDDTRGADLLLRLARRHEKEVSRGDDESAWVDAGIARRLAHEALEDALAAESDDLRRIGREAAELGITTADVDDALTTYFQGEEPDPLWRGPIAGIRTAIEATWSGRAVS